MDLFVWINDADQVTGYQLTYNKPHDEKALCWTEEHGFSHQSVDEGTRPGKHPGSPLLISDGVVDVVWLSSLLKENTGELDVKIKAFIIASIQNFG